MSEIERNQHLTDSHHNGDGNGSSLHKDTAYNGHQAAPLNRAVTPGGHPLDTSQPAFPIYHRKFANPAPLGLFAFASTTLVLSFYNINVRDITHPNVVVGMALSFGGLAQLLAGMWEFATGNTFGATAFTSYGGFWLSYGIINWPSSGIKAAYTDPAELSHALGIFLMTWFSEFSVVTRALSRILHLTEPLLNPFRTVFTFIMMLGTLKSSVGLFSVFFFLTITFLLLGIADLQQSVTIRHAGGAFGLITAFAAYYTGASGLFTPETSYFALPTVDLSGTAKKRV